jgi:hypothetical protein
MCVFPAKFTPIIGQDHLNRQPFLSIEWQDAILNNHHSCLRLFGGVQKSKGIAAVGKHDYEQVDPPHTFEHADEKCVLGRHLSGLTALNLPLLEAGIGLLDPGHMLRS